MTKFKATTFAALMAGVVALPLAGAQAQSGVGVNADVNANVGTSADRNADGANSAATISPSAGVSGDAAITARDYSALDTDRSGGLSQSEYLKMDGAGDFDALDTNGDDMLSLNEIRAQNTTNTDTNVNTSR